MFDNGEIPLQNPEDFDEWMLERPRHPGRVLFSLVADKLLESIQATADIPRSGASDKEKRVEQLYKSGDGQTTIVLTPPERTYFDFQANRPTADLRGVKIEIPIEIDSIVSNWQYKKYEPGIDDPADKQIFGEMTSFQLIEDELLLEQLIKVVVLTFYNRQGEVASVKVVTPETIELYYEDGLAPYVFAYNDASQIDDEEDFMDNEELLTTIGEYGRRTIDVIREIYSWVPSGLDTIRYGLRPEKNSERPDNE